MSKTNANHDTINSTEILSALVTEGICVQCSDSVTSTNSLAKEAAQTDCKMALFAANEQTEGRGRLGRTFASPRGKGVYFSVVALPAEEELQTVTCAAAVAVCRAIEQLLGLSPKIKWVNDILLDGKKICGILAESVPCEQGRATVIGIGVNCNGCTADYPLELRDRVGSLPLSPVSRSKLIARITDCLFAALKEENIIAEYSSRFMLNGATVRFGNKGEQYGTVQGVDDSGRLIVSCNGQSVTVATGEITVVDNE